MSKLDNKGFAQNFPMQCPDFVKAEPSLRHLEMSCLLSYIDKEPYHDHLCLFRALAMYMNGHNDVDSHNSKNFTEILSESGHDPKIFRAFPLKTYLLSKKLCKKKQLYFQF